MFRGWIIVTLESSHRIVELPASAICLWFHKSNCTLRSIPKFPSRYTRIFSRTLVLGIQSISRDRRPSMQERYVAKSTDLISEHFSGVKTEHQSKDTFTFGATNGTPASAMRTSAISRGKRVKFDISRQYKILRKRMRSWAPGIWGGEQTMMVFVALNEFWILHTGIRMWLHRRWSRGRMVSPKSEAC